MVVVGGECGALGGIGGGGGGRDTDYDCHDDWDDDDDSAMLECGRVRSMGTHVDVAFRSLQWR